MPRGELLTWVAFLAVFVHAIGMVGGVYFVFTAQGWLATALGSGRAVTVARIIVGFMWVTSGVLLAFAAWAFLRDVPFWRPWALLGAPLSFAGIVLWAGAVPPGTYVGAALDVAVFAYALAAA